MRCVVTAVLSDLNAEQAGFDGDWWTFDSDIDATFDLALIETLAKN